MKINKMTIEKIQQDEYSSYAQNYINLVTKNIELDKLYRLGKDKIVAFINSLSEKQLNAKYAQDKWTIKEVLQHVIDTERIFIYRCFRIARKDKTPLTSFDQDIYITPSNANNKSKQQLLEEYTATRNYSISVLNSLTNQDLMQVGISSNEKLSARAAAFIIIGHENWHLQVIKNKYL